jgi:hypothetical protein
MKPFSEEILAQADQLVAASKGLDYQGIVEHQPDEVACLHRVLAELNIERSVSANTLDSDDTTVSDPVPEQPEETLVTGDMLATESDAEGKGAVAADRLTIRSGIMESLSADGLEGRVGLVYNSVSKSRTSRFDGVHHHRGIPEFDVVIAPDYAPVPGMHGVFISATEIMSIILPSGDPAANWQVVKRKGYQDRAQMMEYLGLISAGFDLPKE